MNLLLEASTLDDFEKVTWLTHDCYFDLDQAEWSEVERTYSLRFGRGKERVGWFGLTSSKAPTNYDCVLAVRGVSAVEIKDDARIGVYDLDTITFDQQQSAVIIESNIPLTITLTVDAPKLLLFTLGEPHSNEGGLSWYTSGVDVPRWLATALDA
jgi:hypothetical protein